MKQERDFFRIMMSAIVLLLLILSVLAWRWNEGHRWDQLVFKEHALVKISSPDRLYKSISPLVESHAKNKVRHMSLDEKIGQLIIGGFEEPSVTEKTAQLITQYKIGGFIFLRRNLETPEQSLTLFNELKLMNDSNPLPLFFSIDHEGGQITRLPHLSNIPSPSDISEYVDEEKAYVYGQLLGEQLNAFGLHVNFAPVLDINSNPHNPVIGNRAFGKTSRIVSRYGRETMHGMYFASEK